MVSRCFVKRQSIHAVSAGKVKQADVLSNERNGCKSSDKAMKCEMITVLTKQCSQAKLYTYFQDNSKEIDKDCKRPVVLICPGGGYGFTSDREAEPVALQFLAMGFHACVLRYSVAPAQFPQALCELAWSVNYLKAHAKEYGIQSDKIIVAGFSAGGHLAASLGTYWQEEWLEKETGLAAENIRPAGLVLSYPVITSGEFAHRGSFEQLMGKKNTPELNEYLSLEKRVTKNMPPTFVWHTNTDDVVPVENTLLLADAMRKHGVSMEVHIFPEGAHGLSLANEETMVKSSGFGIEPHCQKWITMAGEWIKELL